MAIFGLFDIGKTALFASQTALTVTANNIANVNTPGYSRQEVILEIATPVNGPFGQIGRGVTVAGIRQRYDRFIQAQLLGQYHNYGRSLALDEALGQVEQAFNDPAGLGLSTSLTEFFNAWHEVATNPEGLTQRYALLQKTGSLATAAERMERGILDVLRRTNDEIADIGRRINDIAGNVAALNERIVRTEAGLGAETAADLRDGRDRLLSELAELTDFSAYEDAHGAVSVSVGMRTLVSGARANALTTAVNQDGGRDIFLDGVNITSRIQGGRLGGLLAVRSEVETTALTGLRKLVASVVKEVNLLHRAGFGLDGSTGNDYFAPLQVSSSDYSAGADMTAAILDLSQVTLDEYEVTFDAGGNYYVADSQGTVVASGVYVSGNPFTVDGITMVVTGAVTPVDRFTVSPLENAVANFGAALTDPRTIAASSSAAELPGNNLAALQIAGLADASVADLGTAAFSGFYQGLVSGVGSLKSAASDGLRFDENLLAELTARREALSGVSLDEEAANLIRFQRAFEAGARVIRVADELLQTVLAL